MYGNIGPSYISELILAISSSRCLVCITTTGFGWSICQKVSISASASRICVSRVSVCSVCRQYIVTGAVCYVRVSIIVATAPAKTLRVIKEGTVTNIINNVNYKMK